MKLGMTYKEARTSLLRLERRMIGRQQVLEVDRRACVGCPICRAVCPKEAVTLSHARSEDGRLIARGQIDLAAERCNFCGECAVTCPFKAIRITVDGTPGIPVLQFGVFPALLEGIAVDVSRCDPRCDLACVRSCPANLIAVHVVPESAEAPARVCDVVVEQTRCYYCRQCETACPEGAIAVQRAWEGNLSLDDSRCPAHCRICAEVCPTTALSWDGERVIAREDYCLYCAACEESCPEPGALTVLRGWVRHESVKSGAWLSALERLISPEAKAKNLASKAHSKWCRLYETRMV